MSTYVWGPTVRKEFIEPTRQPHTAYLRTPPVVPILLRKPQHGHVPTLYIPARCIQFEYPAYVCYVCSWLNVPFFDNQAPRPALRGKE